MRVFNTYRNDSLSIQILHHYNALSEGGKHGGPRRNGCLCTFAVEMIMQAEVLEGTAKISLVSDSVLNFVMHALHVGAVLASRSCFVYVCGLIKGGMYSPSF